MRWMVLAGLGLAACSGDGSTAGKAEVRTIALRDFTAVALDGSAMVDVTQGAGFAIQAAGDTADLDRLIVERDGETLRIGQKDDRNWWSGRDHPVRVRITMPVIQAATLAGSGNIAIDRAGGGFVGALTGSGDMTIGQLRGDRAALRVDGSGTIAAAGAVRHLDLSVAGSGDIDAQQVQANDATVAVAGSGNASAAVNGPAQVSLAGSGSATLGAGAQCTVTKTGSGSAHCG